MVGIKKRSLLFVNIRSRCKSHPNEIISFVFSAKVSTHCINDAIVGCPPFSWEVFFGKLGFVVRHTSIKIQYLEASELHVHDGWILPTFLIHVFLL